MSTDAAGATAQSPIAVARATGQWPAKRRVDYFWMVMGKCNYRCPYCVYGLEENDFDLRTMKELHGANEWIAAWRRMHDKYGEGHITLTGGEPTLYPGFEIMAEEISRMFVLAFDTNLSWSKRRLAEFLKRVRPDRVQIETSFHPSSADVHEFIDKAKLIRDSGFEYINRLVAHPPLLGEIVRYRELFAEAGLTFVVNPFHGNYQGKSYPAGYSEEERRLISGGTVNIDGVAHNAPHKEYVKQALDRESPKGRLCRSGYQHVRVETDGTVFRCVEYAVKRWEPLGRFFDDKLELWPAPQTCRAEFCEWEYRWLVDQAERFNSGLA